MPPLYGRTVWRESLHRIVDVERLETIPGMPANPADLPTGCKFDPRCKHCAEICRKEAPSEIMMEGGHMVRCHLFANKGVE